MTRLLVWRRVAHERRVQRRAKPSVETLGANLCYRHGRRANIIESCVIFVLLGKLSVNVNRLVRRAPCVESRPANETRNAPPAVAIAIAGKSSAARRTVRVGPQERLLGAVFQHLALCLELVRILDPHAQARGIQQILKKAEEDRVRGAGAQTPYSRWCERRVDGDETVLAYVNSHVVPVAIVLQSGREKHRIGKEDDGA